MKTITYVLNTIKKFGLFGEVDSVGLVELIQSYQGSVIDREDFRERNVQILKLSSAEKIAERQMNIPYKLGKDIEKFKDKLHDEISSLPDVQLEPNLSKIHHISAEEELNRKLNGNWMDDCCAMKSPPVEQDLPWMESTGIIQTTSQEVGHGELQLPKKQTKQTKKSSPKKKKTSKKVK